MDWYLKVLRENYANFEGRARRTEYWMFQLFNVLAIVVLEVLMGVSAKIAPVLGIPFGLVIIVYALGIIVPSIAVTTRRLHDTDRSGWWQLLQLVPIIGPIVVFIFTVLDSQPGDNRFGAYPK